MTDKSKNILKDKAEIKSPIKDKNESLGKPERLTINLMSEIERFQKEVEASMTLHKIKAERNERIYRFIKLGFFSFLVFTVLVFIILVLSGFIDAYTIANSDTLLRFIGVLVPILAITIGEKVTNYIKDKKSRLNIIDLRKAEKELYDRFQDGINSVLNK